MLIRLFLHLLIVIVSCYCRGEVSDKVRNSENEIFSGPIIKTLKSVTDFALPSGDSSASPALIVVMKGNQTEILSLSTLDRTLLKSRLFDPKLKTILFFPGWTVTPTDRFALQIKQAIETLGGYNFLLADWSGYNSRLYFAVAVQLRKVSNVYGKKLAAMVSAGQISLANWHFMGLSLGAHLSGSTARVISATSSLSKFIVPRITGLDPTGPFIYPRSIFMAFYQGLQASDAAFVDVIHTDELRAGTTYKLGHVDFWVNIDDNMIEPGCPPLVPVGFLDLIFATGFGDENACSHVRSVALMAESIAMNPSKKAFLAEKCTSYQISSKGNFCSEFSNTTINYMGLYATKTPSGNFYLKTKAESPFSLS